MATTSTAAAANQAQDFRVGGAGFTVFHVQGQPLMYAQAVGYQSPQAVAAPQAVQPMDARRPLAIVTTVAITGGTMTLNVYEQFGTKVWDNLMSQIDSTNANNTANQLAVYNDLSDVMLRLMSLGLGLSATKLIVPPRPIGQNRIGYITETMHNITITDIRDDEQVAVDTMLMVKPITIQYTSATRSLAVR